MAYLAGVSSATVSRVFNNPESVSADRREAVFKASAELGYFPDKSASALRRNGTGIITLVDMKKGEDRYSWNSFPVSKWFYSDVIKGIQKVINKTMFQLNLESLESNEQLDRLKNRCDGIIIYDADDAETAEAVRNTGIPYIIAHHTASFRGFNTCSTDNFYGGALQGEILRKRGVSKPVYIAGLAESVVSHSERYRGFCSVFGNTELVDPAGEDRKKFPGVGIEAGRQAVDIIIDEIRNKKIDSAAVVNDFTAAGVYYQLADYNIRVPEDIQIISYDNMPFNSILPRSFTTIDLNPSMIYEKAAYLLINHVMKGEAVSETVKPFPVEGQTSLS